MEEQGMGRVLAGVGEQRDRSSLLSLLSCPLHLIHTGLTSYIMSTLQIKSCPPPPVPLPAIMPFRALQKLNETLPLVFRRA
jgi:hypothetical protein